MHSYTVSSNTIIRNGIRFLNGLVRNLLDADVDEMLFLDGGSTDGTLECLARWSAAEPRVQVVSWAQPDGQSFRGGFREPTRRNLLKMLSTSDYVLYIDVDERISPDFKQHLAGAPYYALPMLHLWGERIRVDTADDRVWSSLKVRLLRRVTTAVFRSRHPSGLHCYLSRRGFSVEPSRTGVKRLVRLALGVEPVRAPAMVMYHLHYVDLRLISEHDLRARDLAAGRVVYLGSAGEGLEHDRRRRHVVCVRDPSGKEKEALRWVLERWGIER